MLPGIEKAKQLNLIRFHSVDEQIVFSDENF